MLTSLYQAGRGIPQDDVKSFELVRSAAELGHADAQFGLGRLLLSGRGTIVNRGETQDWIARAAENGYV